MLLRYINSYIHRSIRKKGLNNIILYLAYSKSNKFDDLVNKIKYIAEDINIDNNSKKYINFLRSFENYKFGNKNKTDILLGIYEIYSTPQKLNNIFLLFLIYYYYHLKNLLKDIALLRIIDVYYYIIYFRNKNQLNLTQPYIYSKIFNQNEKLDTILYSRYNKILVSTVFLTMILFSFFTIGDYQANILSNNEMLSKLFVDTFVFGMPTYDTVYDSVKGTISLYYIFLVVIRLFLYLWEIRFIDIIIFYGVSCT